MSPGTRYTLRMSLCVALGGFLMGFDASVIAGVVTFIEPRFQLDRIELGWAVASLTLTATIAMLCAGPLSDRVGRRPVLQIAGLLFAVSGILSALAPTFLWLVVARMIGGLGVGAALITAPMYIAEISPAPLRGRMVSINQLNIVVGISLAFFSNYLILKLGQVDEGLLAPYVRGDAAWRWMLGIETLPALVFLLALVFVPESPRWLVMHGREDEARRILARAGNAAQADVDIGAVLASIAEQARRADTPLSELFAPSMRLVLTIGVVMAVLQQITGINAVFFYAPMIFEQSGIGTDAAFMQAALVGLTNLVFTVLAILLIDRVGRRPLLFAGLTGVAASLFLLAWGFAGASYAVAPAALAGLPEGVDADVLAALAGQAFADDVAFREAVVGVLGLETWQMHKAAIVAAAIDIDSGVVLGGVLGFVASFAVSLGPVMWVLFSELFPNRLRGLAVSVCGLLNSATSFVVQLVFPWELENFGNAATFLIYGIFAAVGLLLVFRLLPETNGRSLEELETELVGRRLA
ncbi:MAG TPA: sugar porter family MFS transporter [Woeseiaceae bacterium]|nr:sugar porter family MFS transporter [Woeseiaceae bacterium]